MRPQILAHFSKVATILRRLGSPAADIYESPEMAMSLNIILVGLASKEDMVLFVEYAYLEMIFQDTMKTDSIESIE